jgi:hypothetical protein
MRDGSGERAACSHATDRVEVESRGVVPVVVAVILQVVLAQELQQRALRPAPPLSLPRDT